MPEVGPREVKLSPALAADLARIETMWREQLEASGGPFLFGAFSAADAYYAPVCARIRTYAQPVSPATAAYFDSVHGLAAMRTWCEAARGEHDFVADDEPYRTRA